MQAGSPSSYDDGNRLHICLRHINCSHKSITTECVSRSKLELLNYPKQTLMSNSLGDLLMYSIGNPSKITELLV